MNDEVPDQLYIDMGKLNALYEELMWGNEDILEFVADYENNRIIVKNKTLEDTFKFAGKANYCPIIFSVIKKCISR